MAHFRGTVQGGGSEVSRLGHKGSGLTVTANGWTAGVRIEAAVTKDGQDVFQVYATRGSSPAGGELLVATVLAPENGSGPLFRAIRPVMEVA